MTRRIRATVQQWLAIKHMDEHTLAQRIRDDRIDILIDLCGHNAGNRMGTMALQPAPLLVKWVGGLINTTGLDAIDYLLSDRIESPEGEDAYYTENSFACPTITSATTHRPTHRTSSRCRRWRTDSSLTDASIIQPRSMMSCWRNGRN
ncbi:hypothetical protein THH46_12010 [Pseudomonas sp. NA13]